MTLTNRLNLFFMTALAVVLVGFSAALFLLARHYLRQQDEQRLTAALSALVAAAELSPEGVNWDLTERSLNLGKQAFGGQVVWVVTDDHGEVLDQSKEPAVATLVTALFTTSDPQSPITDRLAIGGEPWQIRRQRITSPQMEAVGRAVETAVQDDELKYPAVSIAAAVSLAPTQTALRTLAASLTGLSIGVWLVGLLAGRTVCRWALAPVKQMAAATRQMNAADLTQRLPAPGTEDELESLARGFNSLLDRLQESFERQRRFTGDASHQLRTPLAAIMGQTEIALRRERAAEEYQRTLQTIKQTSEHLRRIVESLLFLARADTDAGLPDREPMDVAAWLPVHVQNWSEHDRFSDFVLNVGEEGPCIVHAHPVLLGELVSVLLDNACKYSPPGTPIRLRLRRAGESIRLDIENESPGIRNLDSARFFTPFYRSADVFQRRIDGVGLGLSIAKRLAEAFGGALSIECHAGDECCVTLTLPVRDCTVLDPTNSISVQQSTSP